MTFALLVQFAFVASVTPGPNNLMLMASGANFGLRRTLPHMLGVSLGHSFMVVMVGVALLRVFDAYPALNLVLKIAGGAYMLWLAGKIARAVPPEAAAVTGTPFTFLQAAAFQWVNPKGWVMAITAISVYAPQDRGAAFGALLVALVLLGTNLPAISLWAWMGVQVRRWLGTAARLRAFNLTMAALLVASLYPLLR